MSNTIIRPKSHSEWLKLREGGIGSSEIATIVGLNPWETPYQLWRRKVGIDPPKEQNFAMKAGHYLEDAVSMFWADETGLQVIKSSAGDWVIRDNDKPHLQVSPDRTYWLAGKPHNKYNKGILECKTTQMKIDSEDIPKTWFCQVQYQLGVAGLEQGSLAWLSGGREFGYKDISFVPDFYAWLVAEADKFWIDHVKAKVEPSYINVKDVMLKYNRHTDGKVEEVDFDIYSMCHDLKEIKKQMDALEEAKEKLEGNIKMAFGDAEAITFAGETIATWKAPKPSSKLDTKALVRDEPCIAAKYMVPTQGARRFILK